MSDPPPNQDCHGCKAWDHESDQLCITSSLCQTSALEGCHLLSVIRVNDDRGRHGSIRIRKTVKVAWHDWRWNVRLLAAAGVISCFIGHYHLWLRDALSDVVSGRKLQTPDCLLMSCRRRWSSSNAKLFCCSSLSRVGLNVAVAGGGVCTDRAEAMRRI